MVVERGEKSGEEVDGNRVISGVGAVTFMKTNICAVPPVPTQTRLKSVLADKIPVDCMPDVP